MRLYEAMHYWPAKLSVRSKSWTGFYSGLLRHQRLILLESLNRRPAVPTKCHICCIFWLDDCASPRLCVAILRILCPPADTPGRSDLSAEMLQGIAARLEMIATRTSDGQQWRRSEARSDLAHGAKGYSSAARG